MDNDAESRTDETEAEGGTEVTFRPWRRGKPIPSAAVQCCLNSFAQLRAEKPFTPVTEIVKRVSELSGIASSSIHKFRKQALGLQHFKTPGKVRPNRVGRYTRSKLLDGFTIVAIRQKVHDFFRRNESPTVEKVLAEINKDNSLPNFKRVSLYRLFKDLGFQYVRGKRRSMLIDREEVILWRRRYLRDIRKYRNEGKKIYYTDETWMTPVAPKAQTEDSMTKSSEQPDDETSLENSVTKNSEQAGDATCPKTPAAKECPYILVHAGSETGFVIGALNLFRAMENSLEYHGDMDGPYYETWFKTKLLPKLEPDSVIVLDNAPYHSVQKEVFPGQNWQKAEIQAWLVKKGIQYAPGSIKAELLALTRTYEDRVKAYKIDLLAKEAGHVVLRLPPNHCELNPIELIWVRIKGFVTENTLCNTMDMENSIRNAVAQVTPEIWANCCRHVLEQEQRLWELDSITDDVVDRFISLDNESNSANCGGDDDDHNHINSTDKCYACKPPKHDLSRLEMDIWPDSD